MLLRLLHHSSHVGIQVLISFTNQQFKYDFHLSNYNTYENYMGTGSADIMPLPYLFRIQIDILIIW